MDLTYPTNLFGPITLGPPTGLYAVLWGKYKEYKEKEAEEFLEPVKDTNNNNARMMIKDIKANNVEVMQKNEVKTVMSPATFAISAPIPTLPMLAVEAPKP
ncbi:hypothetical protein POM88_041452 [Heracleum sosnowskyi]|uniref:Uncharacterized protein n=1 Tax=Heracleum sosnowskyi TaxID=360622 RepID=A0AAD8HG75_9APIA|nr:hypothetical protein POM88_041452 [Heracleum sosnowskyi]